MLISLGEFALALDHFEQALIHFNPASRQISQTIPHLEIACLLYSGLALWLLVIQIRHAPALTRVSTFPSSLLILLLLLLLRRTIKPSWLTEARPDQSDSYYPG